MNKSKNYHSLKMDIMLTKANNFILHMQVYLRQKVLETLQELHLELV